MEETTTKTTTETTRETTTETTTETPTDTPTASTTQTWTGEKTCCCKSESKVTLTECDAKGYKWVKASHYPRFGLKDRCCTFKNGSCPFFSHYKKVEEEVCV